MILIQLLIGIGLMILGYILMPKTATTTEAVTELDAPTAEAGKSIPVVFGDELVQELNILGWWDKGYERRWKKGSKK